MNRELNIEPAVYAVPPLARKAGGDRTIDFEENMRIVHHIVQGGITRLIYGGNAFFYHLTLREYEQVLEWLSSIKREGQSIIVSAGPSFGRLMDQAPLLKRFGVSCVMVLPCGDPRDASGIARGLREFADASGARVLAYVKDENNMGVDRDGGLDILGELVNEDVCAGIKYAVVRQDPADDPYLQALIERVDRSKIISGIGERPAIVHLRQWGLSGFTTGSGCLAPAQSTEILRAYAAGDFAAAEQLRERFLGIEDLRDLWGPARVLHHATELAGIAHTGSIPPFVSPLSSEQQNAILPLARQLVAQDRSWAGTHNSIEM
jgi:4-hydroxy-tetrahydrodipicolinate synthase